MEKEQEISGPKQEGTVVFEKLYRTSLTRA